MNEYRNLGELLERRAAERGDTVYLCWQDEEVSYAAFDRRVNQVASGLRGLGAGAGQQVALLLRNCPEFLYTFFACAKLGAVAVRALCERLRVPVKYRELALVVCLHHTRCHRVLEMRAPAIVSLLEDVDALRNGERFEEFLAACEADARGRTGLERHPYAQAEKLRRARAAAATVTAAPALARGLRGPQIAAEMHRLRCIEVARLEGEDHGQ